MRRFLGLLFLIVFGALVIAQQSSAGPALAEDDLPLNCDIATEAQEEQCADYEAFQELVAVFKRVTPQQIEREMERQQARLAEPPPAPATDGEEEPADEEPPPGIITCLGQTATIVGTSAGTLNGTEGDDIIWAGPATTINALAGNDIICVGTGTKTINGGDDLDLISYGDLIANVNGTGIVADLQAGTVVRRGTSTTIDNCNQAAAAGRDITHTITGIESVDGTIFRDCLLGDALPNAFEGRASPDLIDGRGDVDAVTFLITPFDVTVNLSTNPATAVTRDTVFVFCSTALAGPEVTDRLVGIESVLGSSCEDTITGSSGNDIFEGLGRDDVINGGGGNDIISGGDGDDTLNGDAGNDVLSGGNGDDTLDGGNNDDALEGGPGADELIGGSGLDTAAYVLSIGPEGDEEAGAVNVNLATGVTSGGDAVGDTFSGIENLGGSNYNDTLTGTSGPNRIAGNGGDDTIDGGGGDDQADYSIAPNGVTVNIAAGTATGHGTDTLISIEGAFGSTYDDVLRGSSGPNILNGLAGNDIIIGYEGVDTIDGGDDVDTCDFVGADTHLNCEDNDADGYLDGVDNNPNVFCGIMRSDIPNEQGVSSGIIDIVDISVLAGNFGRQVPPASFRYDQEGFNFEISLIDLSIVAGNFGRSVTACP